MGDGSRHRHAARVTVRLRPAHARDPHTCRTCGARLQSVPVRTVNAHGSLYGGCNRRHDGGRGSLGADRFRLGVHGCSRGVRDRLHRRRRGLWCDVGCRSRHRRHGLDGDRLGDRLLLRRRRRARRQHAQRVEVALLVGGSAYAEVDERLRRLHDAGRADGADDLPFGNRGAARNLDRAQVDERRGHSQARADRDALAAGRDGSREGDDTVDRRAHGRSRGRAEIDAAVLPCGVRMRPVERERAQDRPVDGPRPRVCSGHGQRECAKTYDSESPEHTSSLLPGLITQRR